METGSPTALTVTLRALRNAARMRGIEECLRQDYRVSVRFLDQPDLREGIRAAVLDKDTALAPRGAVRGRCRRRLLRAAW